VTPGGCKDERMASKGNTWIVEAAPFAAAGSAMATVRASSRSRAYPSFPFALSRRGRRG
jgi:hypothetical protein